MKRIIFFASFVGALFLLAGVSYFFLLHGTKASAAITNTRVENIIGGGAQVKWDTDIPSDSRVAYGANTSFSLFSNTRCDSGGYVTSHCVNLTGLSVSTAYYYKVESMDTGGVDAQSTVSQFTSAAAVINDPTLPAPPTSLSVSLNTAGTDATFTWASGGSNESSFKISRRLSGDSTWAYFMSLNASSTSFVYPGIPYGTYEYTVAACSVYGCSANANTVIVSRSPTPDTTAPSKPQAVSAVGASSSQINLSWTASTDNISVSGYNVYRDGSFVGTTAALSYSDTALSSVTSYSYTVAAVDNAGNLSQGSAPVTATTLVDTAAVDTANIDITPPVISSIDTKNIMGTGAQIIWTTDDRSNSKVYYGTASGAYPLTSTWRCDAGGNVTDHCVNLTNLASKTPYYYQVVSKNIDGYETKSAEQTFTSATGTQIVTTTATTTNITTTTATMTLAPVVFSVKISTPWCKDGYTVAPVYFALNPATGGYFTLKSSAMASSQMLENTGLQLPSGTYAWQGTPKIGYYASGSANGTFTIPTLAACSPVTSVTVASSPTVATYDTSTTNTKTTVVQQSTPTSPTVAPQPLPIAIATAPKSPVTESSTAPALVNSVVAEVAQPESYQETEDLLRQKYQEAEMLFRKENKVPVSRNVAEEEKKKLVEEVHSQFSVLAQASDSILLGTTTLSRTSEPERTVAEVLQVITKRAETLLLVDTDSDGISDYDELHIYGTDPNKADTDGDGIKDGDEILSGTDPLKKAVAPLPHEDPKETVLAAKVDAKLFSVEKVALTEAVQSASSTKTASSSSPRIAFEGTALPNSFVTVYIFSTPIVVTVKTDSDGKWKYTMDKELENGKHEVYVAMTESAGKILVKSEPIPFVKTAQAVTLQPDFALADSSSSEVPASFFRGGTLALSLAVLFIILGLCFMLISFVSKKKDNV